MPSRFVRRSSCFLLALLLAAIAGCSDDDLPVVAPTSTATSLPTATVTSPPTATHTTAPTSTATSQPTQTSTATAVPTATITATPTETSTPSPTTTRGIAVARPTIEGPVSGGNGAPFLATTSFDLALVGYQQAELFIAGTATSYSNTAPLNVDGNWSVEPATTAPYKTRILAYRPIDAADFNGTVIVEWLNVSGGLDSAAEWISAHRELVREGYAWVGVSAQAAGVETGTSVVGLVPRPLKTIDPVRYGSLSHPGDSFSYDIFSQAAQAIRRPGDIRPLGDLAVERLIVAAESQSAFRMVTYINAVQPLTGMFDGFLVHSRGSFGTAPLSESPQPSINVPGTARIRTDLDVPVLTFETETDISLLGFAAARQDDTDLFRIWEVAGAAHADTYTTGAGITDLGNSPSVADLVVTSMPVEGISCTAPINSGPGHFVLNAAFAALNRWVVEGTLPPIAPRLEVNGTTIVRDANGIARGGIRTPQVDVPIAKLSGEGQVGSLLCLLFGTTVPFDEAKLAALYPDHETYVAAYEAATDRAVAAGFILPADAVLMKASAAQADIP